MYVDIATVINTRLSNEIILTISLAGEVHIRNALITVVKLNFILKFFFYLLINFLGEVKNINC